MPQQIEMAFRAFHQKNPDVYAKLVDLARRAKRAGKTNIGIGMLYEVVRWDYYLTTSDDDFKLNNNYRSRYARLIMDAEPDLAGIFHLRELRA